VQPAVVDGNNSFLATLTKARLGEYHVKLVKEGCDEIISDLRDFAIENTKEEFLAEMKKFGVKSFSRNKLYQLAISVAYRPDEAYDNPY